MSHNCQNKINQEEKNEDLNSHDKLYRLLHNLKDPRIGQQCAMLDSNFNFVEAELTAINVDSNEIAAKWRRYAPLYAARVNKRIVLNYDCFMLPVPIFHDSLNHSSTKITYKLITEAVVKSGNMLKFAKNGDWEEFQKLMNKIPVKMIFRVIVE